MATVRLSDVQFDEDVYLSYLQEDRTDRNAYIASGVAVTNEQLNARAGGEGEITSIPYWKDLNADNENLSNDDPADYATPEKIGTGLMTARKLFLNNAWQSANLVSSLIGSEDPMRQIASRTSAYWDQRFAARIQGATLGIFLDNEGGSGDMIFDISEEDDSAVTDADRFNYAGFVDAVATMGESDDALTLIGVHPKTLARMRKENNIEYIQDSETGLMIPFYNGKRVVVDKKLPVIAGTTSGSRYVTVLYGPGVFGYGSGSPKYPVAVEMDELAGNGAGVETLVERKEWLIHPEGYKFTSNSVAGQSPTVAEYQAATNWERQYERENVALAFFVHN
ncbi:hypothetical protein [Alloalcanivorax venustensis]|jgi:hypothetical protein|uniref:hypothetical protein n=1 Tax=Alloalcanivorax venustensis TaxID=172371 RepID=UPI0039E496EE